MIKNSKGIVHILLLIVVAILLAGGAFLLLRRDETFPLSKLSNIQFPDVLQKPSGDQIKPKTERVRGKANPNDQDALDALIDESRVSGTSLGKIASVADLELKSGVHAYLVVPPSLRKVAYAELAEYEELPTEPANIPLYTDFGYGVNVSLEGRVDDDAYLIFDFGGGKKLEEFTQFNKYRNYCDYSFVFFDPEICAMALSVPPEKTLNPKYIAVSPRYIGDTPFVTPLYSYYLGTDDLLVVNIDRSQIVILQPLTRELVLDLIKDTEGKQSTLYKDQTEIADLIRNLKISFEELGEVKDATNRGTAFDFKAIYSNLYFEEMTKDEELKKDLNEENKNLSQNYLSIWSEFGSLGETAHLRRAVDSKLPGSEGALIASLERKLKEIDGLTERLKETEPVHQRLFPALEHALILLGNIKYNEKTGWNFTSFLPVALAQKSPPQSVIVATKTLVETSIEFNLTILDINFLLWLSGEIETESDLDRLSEQLQEKIKEAVDNATSISEKLDAYAACSRYYYDKSVCNDLKEKILKDRPGCRVVFERLSLKTAFDIGLRCE
ncbi:hypothetical protein HY008_01640 [Candidatus Woesebacteria bacterium]|nr:hypothetical protein [Candidatus Woesebacteria bacterium]